MQDLLQMCSAALDERQTEQRIRRLRSVTPLNTVEVMSGGQRLINFSSNDYLGLSQHPALKARAISYIEKYGVGNPASRLLSGNLEVYETIESKLASLKGTESALILGSGFQTNATIFAALADKTSYICCDRFSHHSLLQGIQLSAAKWNRYRHNDLDALSDRLQSGVSAASTRRWIVSESVFSMDGDTSDVDNILKIGTTYDANIFFDEAHATGVLGVNGMGLTVGKDVTVAMGTFGKGCGSFGSYVACSQTLKDYLINFCSGLIYSTALPPPVLGAIDAALDLIPEMGAQRAHLLEQSEHVRTTARHLGYDTGSSSTQIIPIILGEDSDALSLAEYLQSRGILAPAIRTPTVPEGSARVRLSLCAGHIPDQIDHLIDCLRKWRAPKN